MIVDNTTLFILFIVLIFYVKIVRQLFSFSDTEITEIEAEIGGSQIQVIGVPINRSEELNF